MVNVTKAGKLVISLHRTELQAYFRENWANLGLSVYPTEATGYGMDSCPTSLFIKFVNCMDGDVRITEV